MLLRLCVCIKTVAKLHEMVPCRLQAGDSNHKERAAQRSTTVQGTLKTIQNQGYNACRDL